MILLRRHIPKFEKIYVVSRLTIANDGRYMVYKESI